MSRPAFDLTQDFRNTDFRRHPELYRIGKGEQGVLLVEPCKGEILPHWRFRTVAEAKESSARIFEMFAAYLEADDFPGADMARKFLQMGWTRARRYANHRGGRKYDKETGAELPRAEDAEKAAAAAVFYERYVAARQHPEYLRLKPGHRERYEGNESGRDGYSPHRPPDRLPHAHRADREHVRRRPIPDDRRDLPALDRVPSDFGTGGHRRPSAPPLTPRGSG